MDTLEDYDREICRRLWSRRFRAMGEIAGEVLILLAAALIGWAYLAATPDQLCGENDWTAAEVAQ
jgi:hypothetical protein